MKIKAVRSTPAIVAAALSACAGVNNDRSALATEPPALQPASAASIVSVSRENWARRTYTVEPDVLEHYPNYTTLRPMPDNAAANAEHPTIETAIPADDPSSGALGAGAAAPFIAAWEIVRMPFMMIGQWPGSVSRSGPAWYDRYHEPTTTFDLGARSEPIE